MIGIYDLGSGILEAVVESTSGYDLAGKGTVAAPSDYDGVAVNYRFEAGAFVANLPLARTKLKARIIALRNAAEAGGCDVPGIGRFDTDPDSQRKVTGTVLMSLMAPATFDVDWRISDNSIVTLDAAAMALVGTTIGAHVAACQYRKNELDAACNAASSLAELEAINIEAGWPG